MISQASLQVSFHLRRQKNPLPSPRPPSITRVENTKKKAENENEIHLRIQVNAQVSSHLRNPHLTVAYRTKGFLKISWSRLKARLTARRRLPGWVSFTRFAPAGRHRMDASG